MLCDDARERLNTRDVFELRRLTGSNSLLTVEDSLSGNLLRSTGILISGALFSYKSRYQQSTRQEGNRLVKCIEETYEEMIADVYVELATVVLLGAPNGEVGSVG